MHPRTVGHLCRHLPFSGRPPALPKRYRAFTLIELLVVIAIIAILVGLLFPAFKAVQNQARQTQAKNDLTQIVNAVNAFYTDYGKYPIATNDTPIGPDNSGLMYTLRADSTNANGKPKREQSSRTLGRSFLLIRRMSRMTQLDRDDLASVQQTDRYYDPWGTPYRIAIDGDYTNTINPNPYTANTGAGPSPLAFGVIAWSWGPDQTQGTTNFSASDDVISWQ